MSTKIETPADEIMALLVQNVLKLLGARMAGEETISAAEISAIGRLLNDSSVTLSSVKRGDFGELAKSAAEEFPFPDEGPDFDAQARPN